MQKSHEVINRTRWNEEDEAVFLELQAEHKKLSDRLASLHCARYNKTSIAEWDNKRMEKY